MLQFFLHRDNIPFAVAIGILAGILALEVIGAVLRFSLSGDNEADASIDLEGAVRALGVGAAPATIEKFEAAKSE